MINGKHGQGTHSTKMGADKLAEIRGEIWGKNLHTMGHTYLFFAYSGQIAHMYLQLECWNSIALLYAYSVTRLKGPSYFDTT